MTAPSALPDDRASGITHARVLLIAVPMTLAYLSTPIVGLVDTTVIGRLGSAELLGGIAVGALIFDVLFTTFNFLRTGTTGLTAQALGAQDRTREAAILARALIIALLGGLAMIVLAPLIAWISLALMQPEGLVRQSAADYFAVRIWSAPFALANYAVLGWFVGLGRSGTALGLQTILNGVNVLATVYFVNVLGWGVAGAAYGSIAGEFCATIAGLLFAARAMRGVELPGWTRIANREAVMRMLAVNRDIMIRSFTLLFAFAFFTAQSTKFGAVVLAANAVLMNFFIIGGYFLDGLATAAEQLVGQAIGANRRQDFDRSVRISLGWSLAMGAICSAAVWVAGPYLIDFMTTAEDVRTTARSYLVWAALTPLVGALAFQMDGVFIGATWSEEMRNMMLLSLLLYLAVWLVAVPLHGNHGLWFALLVFLSARGTTLYWRMGRRAAKTFS